MAAPVRASNDPGADDDSGSVDKQKDMLESTNQFAKADQESSEEDDGPQFEYPAAAVAAAAASPAQKSSAVSDLIFSSDQASHQFNHILTALKRANLSMHNRLRSIQADALFVQDVQRAYYYNSESIISTTGTASTTSSSPSTGTGRPRPLVANERCGSWYIPPGLKRGSAYFKSTDGHHGIWAFSTRRLNLHLLDLIGRHDGCIVVDSTRRGKRMPDALSKTVPMWCCVVNNVLFPDGVLRTGPATLSSSRNGDEGEAGEGGKDNVSATEPPCYEPHRLYTPPNAVSASEHAQMESRVPAHADALRRLGLDLAPYRAALRRPIRPVWVTQESRLDVPEDEDDGGGGVAVFEDFHPVICCTSSRRVAGGEMSEGGYIQGAGDDTENWAFGLTPPVFWANADLLLSTPEAELPDLVRSLVDRANAAPTPRGVESDATAVTAPGDEASSLSSLSLAPILSRYQQVAPEIYVARTADLDPRLLAGGTSSTFIPFPKVDKDSGNSTINNDNENNSLCTIVLHQQTPATDPSTWAKTPTHMDVGLGGKQSKIASRNLRAALPQVAEFVREFLEKKTAAAVVPPAITATIMDNDKSRDGSSSGGSSQKPRILIACDTGRDLSVGVALALVCQHCCTAADAATTTTMAGSGSGSGSGSGGLEFRPRRDTDGVNKTLIKSRLGHIMARFPDGNPSRATLQSVNSYLMG